MTEWKKYNFGMNYPFIAVVYVKIVFFGVSEQFLTRRLPSGHQHCVESQTCSHICLTGWNTRRTQQTFRAQRVRFCWDKWYTRWTFTLAFKYNYWSLILWLVFHSPSQLKPWIWCGRWLLNPKDQQRLHCEVRQSLRANRLSGVLSL